MRSTRIQGYEMHLEHLARTVYEDRSDIYTQSEILVPMCGIIEVIPACLILNMKMKDLCMEQLHYAITQNNDSIQL